MVLTTTSDDVRRTDVGRRTRETNVAIMSAVAVGRPLRGREGGNWKEGTRGHRRTVGEKEKNYGLVGHSTHSLCLSLSPFLQRRSNH